MRLRTFVVLAIGLLGLSLARTRPALGFLRAHGDQIVESRTGEPVLLRGIGLGGWLVPEGYMLHMPGYGSPTSIANMIEELIGAEATARFFERYRANYVAEEDIAKIAEWGFNCIRLPFHYAVLTPPEQPGVFLEEGWQIFDRMVQWCEKYQLYLIFDMHCAPGGQNKDNISDSDGIEARLWTDPANQDRTVEIWRTIAERYADEEWVGGYDLLNEPVLPAGHSTSELRSLYMRIAQAIREVDPNHLIFIEGKWYATDFSNLTPPFDGNMAYSFHKYWNEPTRATIQYLLQIRKRYHVPLWLGESGENSNPWFGTCVRLMEENNIGWCWWTHKKIQTTTSPYSAPLTEGYQQLLNYWRGQGPRPDADFAKTALLDQAEKLKLEYCQFLPDVVDALLRSDFTRIPQPYAENVLPGRLLACEYDMGSEGVAYHDTDYWKVHGPQSNESWNRGGRFRNDGVDVELSGDREGNGYSVGWIETGEWLKFTVRVDIAGAYRTRLRVASPQGTGTLQIFLDDSALTQPVAIRATGGWKNWEYQDGPVVELPGGTHTLKIYFPTGGFNLNFVDFQVQDTSVERTGMYHRLRSGVWVGQIYPNPATAELRLPVVANAEADLKIQIFDARGGLVKTLCRSRLVPGTTEVLWDGSGPNQRLVPSGVYLCVIESGGQRVVQKVTVLH